MFFYSMLMRIDWNVMRFWILIYGVCVVGVWIGILIIGLLVFFNLIYVEGVIVFL